MHGDDDRAYPAIGGISAHPRFEPRYLLGIETVADTVIQGYEIYCILYPVIINVGFGIVRIVEQPLRAQLGLVEPASEFR